MSTDSLSYGNSLDIVRDVSQAVARLNSDNICDLFNGIIEFISKTVKCNACAAYERNVTGSFNLIKGYKLESIPFINNIFKSTGYLAAEAMLQLKTHYLDTETSNYIYYVPIKSLQPFFFLMFSFHKKLDAQGVQLLEAIAHELAANIDKLVLKQKLQQQYLSTVKSLVVAIEAKDVYTQGHSQRVASYAKLIGKHLNLQQAELDELEITGLVHDIGKIGISDGLLTKPDCLTEAELDTIKQHPQIGIKILMPLGVSENVMLGTLLHHKRYDLKGYPINVDIDKLPLVPAIIGVADAYDAMTSERVYKNVVTKNEALLELKNCSGTQFDPMIVDIMTELVEKNII